MFCSNCGSEIIEGANACTVCGTMVAGRTAPRRQDDRMPAANPAPSARQSRSDSYEYARTTVRGDLATVATDCYESLGYELTGSKESPASGTTSLSFRRSRKVRGKAQLSKLQRTMDDLLRSIASMEADKTRKARARAIAIGTISALILGVGMCCTMVWTNLFVLGVVVGIVGIAGCAFAFMDYRKTVARDTARINPRIESTYDQLATACEEAQAILREPDAL